jgi:hypothetical protein
MKTHNTKKIKFTNNESNNSDPKTTISIDLFIKNITV